MWFIPNAPSFNGLYNDESNTSDESSIEISVDNTGIEEIELSQIEIYPNPEINILIINDLPDNTTIDFFSLAKGDRQITKHALVLAVQDLNIIRVWWLLVKLHGNCFNCAQL